MTDEEVAQVAARIAADKELHGQFAALAKSQGFVFSDNFKWLMVTIAIPLTTFLFGVWQERVAATRAEAQQQVESQKRELEARLGDARNNVAAMTALLPALADDDPRKARLALIVLEQLKQAQRSNDTHLADAAEAMRKLIAELQHSDDPEDLRRGADLQEAYSVATGARPASVQAATTTVAAARVDQATSDKPRVVYLQIFGDAQRAEAESVRSMLRENGVGAPGIEDVSGKLAGRMRRAPPQIRYFSEGDLGRASWLAENLQQVQGQRWTVVRTRAQGVPAGQLELWWPFPAPG